MAKKVWKEWTLKFKQCAISRDETGEVSAMGRETAWQLTPAEARRLFQKLSGDYKD